MNRVIRNVVLGLSVILVISFGVSILTIDNGNEGIVVKYVSNNDGDTARFIINNEEVKCRFIGIDTPEINKDEPYAVEAKEYVQDLLLKANKIILEKDPKSDEYDKFNRKLVWVFVDDELLQDLLVKEGLAKVRYIYDDYRYVDILNKSQNEAKRAKIGIWS